MIIYPLGLVYAQTACIVLVSEHNSDDSDRRDKKKKEDTMKSNMTQTKPATHKMDAIERELDRARALDEWRSNLMMRVQYATSSQEFRRAVRRYNNTPVPVRLRPRMA